MSAITRNDQITQGDMPAQTREARVQTGKERIEQHLQEMNPRHLDTYQVIEVSGLDLLKLVEGTNDPQAVRNKIKVALDELAMRDILQRDYAFSVDYEPVYLKPEESLEEHHRLTLYGKRPDAVVFSGSGSDRGEISSVFDVKAWSEVSLTLGEEQLRKRAEAYAALPELSRQGKIVFALPNDTITAQPVFVDQIRQWCIGGHAVEIIPFGRTNVELNAQVVEIIAQLREWADIQRSRTSVS